MRRKYGKFYADWTDPLGHRRMKALPTKKAALKYQAKMRTVSAAKKVRASAPSGISPRRGRKRIPAPPKTRAASHAS